MIFLRSPIEVPQNIYINILWMYPASSPQMCYTAVMELWCSVPGHSLTQTPSEMNQRWGSEEAAPYLRDVTSHDYAQTQLLNYLMINVLLNYMAFSTRAVRPNSSPLVNTKPNEGSMARKKAFTASGVLVNNKTTAKGKIKKHICILIKLNSTTWPNLQDIVDKISR